MPKRADPRLTASLVKRRQMTGEQLVLLYRSSRQPSPITAVLGARPVPVRRALVDRHRKKA